MAAHFLYQLYRLWNVRSIGNLPNDIRFYSPLLAAFELWAAFCYQKFNSRESGLTSSLGSAVTLLKIPKWKGGQSNGSHSRTYPYHLDVDLWLWSEVHRSQRKSYPLRVRSPVPLLSSNQPLVSPRSLLLNFSPITVNGSEL